MVDHMEHEMVARWEAALAETLRAERAAAKLTQVELAAKAGIPRVTYNRYETGERRPNVVQVAQIADGLGMKLSTFLGRVEARASEQ